MIAKKFGYFALVIFTLSVLMLTGCGANAEQGTETAAETPTETSTEEATDQPVAEKEELVVGVSGEFFPASFTENDQLQGFEIDVWNEIAKRTNIDVEYKTGKFVGLIGMLDAGQVDTVAYPVSITEERKEKYSFSIPYEDSDMNLVTKKGSALDTEEAFRGKKVGVVMGGIGVPNLTKFSEERGLDIEVVTYEGVGPMNEDTVLGRIDARVGPKDLTQIAIDQNDLDLEVTDIVIFTTQSGYPFRKLEETKSTVEAVNGAIQAMKDDGTLAELHDKWY